MHLTLSLRPPSSTHFPTPLSPSLFQSSFLRTPSSYPAPTPSPPPLSPPLLPPHYVHFSSPSLLFQPHLPPSTQTTHIHPPFHPPYPPHPLPPHL
uniref:Uncharacterized protein n=1 Tax=Knipowitschia caucasica TaxID=637954 RepID=A0AAV2KU45_KNICA